MQRGLSDLRSRDDSDSPSVAGPQMSMCDLTLWQDGYGLYEDIGWHDKPWMLRIYRSVQRLVLSYTLLVPMHNPSTKICPAARP